MMEVVNGGGGEWDEEKWLNSPAYTTADGHVFTVAEVEAYDDATDGRFEHDVCVLGGAHVREIIDGHRNRPRDDRFLEYVRSFDSQEPRLPAVIVEMDDLSVAFSANVARELFGFPTWPVVFDSARCVASSSNEHGFTLDNLGDLAKDLAKVGGFEVEFEDVSSHAHPVS